MDNDDNVISTRTVLFSPEKKLALPYPELSLDITVSDGVAQIRVKAKKYARYVKLFARGISEPFSDNYFDLVAGEEKLVTLPVPGDMTADKAREIV